MLGSVARAEEQLGRLSRHLLVQALNEGRFMDGPPVRLNEALEAQLAFPDASHGKSWQVVASRQLFAGQRHAA